MSWWETGNGDDVIGDEPADALQDALRGIAAASEGQSRTKPTLAQLLAAIAAVLHTKARDVLAEASLVQSALVARLADGSVVRSESDDNGQLATMVASLTAAAEAIARIYNDRFARRPRLSELLAVISFVLRGQPERYLAISNDQQIRSIEVASL